MMTACQKGKSLTFYQATSITSTRPMLPAYTGACAAVPIANISMYTAAITGRYNTQLNDFLVMLNAKRAKDAATLDLSSPNARARSFGVKRGWEYEQADVKMGGKGSGNWNKQERGQIRERGTVRNAQGHHQKNVANHPEEQADPDNIKFYPTQKEHLEKGHDGNFGNESDGPKIDKNKMLQRTNSKRVFRNELCGIGIAVGIGLCIGFTIEFAVTLAQSGVSPDSVKMAFIQGTKGSIESGVMAGVGYGIGRTIGEVATNAMTGLLENAGIAITDNISKMCSMGIVGALTIAVFSVYQFAKLRRAGIGTREAMLIVGRQVLFSLSLLAVAIAAQGVFEGPAGIIVSVSIGVILISCTTVGLVYQRKFLEKIRICTIEKCCPEF